MQKLQDLRSQKPTLFIAASIILLILAAISSALPVAMIVIGAYYQNNCPMERYIPIWLIVQGSTGMLLILISVITSIVSFRGSKSTMAIAGALTTFTSVVTLFLIAWSIAGNVWVYSNFKKVQTLNPDSTADYCNYTLYYFSFWIITVGYIMLGLVCIIGLCVGCIACIGGTCFACLKK